MKLENLTQEEQAFLARRYYKAMNILEQLIDEQYRNINFAVCRAKGIFVQPCPFTVLTDETNPLNDPTNMEAEGYCLGAYMPDQRIIAVNAEAIVRMVIERTGKCSLKKCALIAIDTVAHELTHYIQDMSGDTFDMETEYYNRAHEVEARAVGEHVTMQYKETILDLLYDIQMNIA